MQEEEGGQREDGGPGDAAPADHLVAVEEAEGHEREGGRLQAGDEERGKDGFGEKDPERGVGLSGRAGRGRPDQPGDEAAYQEEEGLGGVQASLGFPPQQAAEGEEGDEAVDVARLEAQEARDEDTGHSDEDGSGKNLEPACFAVPDPHVGQRREIVEDDDAGQADQRRHDRDQRRQVQPEAGVEGRVEDGRHEEEYAGGEVWGPLSGGSDNRLREAEPAPGSRRSSLQLPN